LISSARNAPLRRFRSDAEEKHGTTDIRYARPGLGRLPLGDAKM
jgi:hypothetical protein